MIEARSALVAIALVLIPVACSDGDFVESIELSNPTDYRAKVDVTDGTRSGWLNLATVGAASEMTVQEVFDQGTTWIFRFTYTGHSEELRLSSAELAESGWRVTVPTSFESQLRADGVIPPP